MHEVRIDYKAFEVSALIKIFELAELLNTTPKSAAKTYLLYKAKTQENPQAKHYDK